MEIMGIKTLNEIKRLGKFAIGEINVKEITLLKKNARFMKKELFDRLVENVKKDGELSSLPFCYYDREKDTMTVLSGNHRVRSLLANGMDSVVIMYNTVSMTEDEKTSLQLAHNAISGEDDTQILKELYESIQGLELKVLSGLDDSFFTDMENKTASLIESLEIPTVEVMLFFTDEVVDKFSEILSNDKVSEYVFMGKKENYRKYLELAEVIKKNYNILNGALIFEVLCDIYQRYVDTENNGFDGSISIEGHCVFQVGGTKSLVSEKSATKLRRYIKDAGGIDEFIDVAGSLFGTDK